jgi:MEMO1 family protein
VSARLRRPAVAGRFYPRDPAELATLVERCLGRPAHDPTAATDLRAVVVPHAGYVASGPVAGLAYARLAPLADQIALVVIAGPSHFVPFDGVATSGAEAFETPLGLVPIDDEARDRALRVSGVIVDDRAHRDEHSIEVQLPFLQLVLGRFTILPLLTGRRSPAVLAAVLDELWNHAQIQIVISTDLSHYLDEASARKLDLATARAVLDGRDHDLAPEYACGVHALQAMIMAARRHRLAPTLLGLATSADTLGQPERVVGYGAFTYSSVRPLWTA